MASLTSGGKSVKREGGRELWMLASPPMAAAAQSPTSEPIPAEEGWERPAFAKSFPREEELDDLVRAFEEGNYARVRVEAPKLAERATDPEVSKAARELRKRLDPDPLAYVVLSLTTALLAFLSGWFLWHSH